jgi:antitoxin ParD1/3/4
MGMNVNLTPQLEELVRAKVESGLYNSASEVVREALRLMDELDRVRAAKLEQLKAEVRRGLNSGHSQAWGAATVKREARAKRSSKPAKAKA